MEMNPLGPVHGHPLPDGQRKTELMAQSRGLEAAFLAEMLGYAGMGETEGEFGGGIGEAQFASFLRQEQAKGIVQKGGIGLAEQIFHVLSARQA